MGESTVMGVVIAVIGLVGSVLVARISTPRERSALERMADEPEEGELRVSPEIWRRFSVLEEKVDHLTAIVEQQKEKVTGLERLLRIAMRIVRHANRRLVAVHEIPEEVPRDLVPYSVD